MSHFAAYWQMFDHPDEPLVVTGWRIGLGNRLADAVKGDYLWLFTSGLKCRKKHEEDVLPVEGVRDTQAYLTEIFTINRIVPETTGRFKLLVQGIENKCVGVFGPFLIDGIVRPDGWGKDKPIGNLRQGAWQLPEHDADRLKIELKTHRPGAYRKVFG